MRAALCAVFLCVCVFSPTFGRETVRRPSQQKLGHSQQHQHHADQPVQRSRRFIAPVHPYARRSSSHGGIGSGSYGGGGSSSSSRGGVAGGEATGGRHGDVCFASHEIKCFTEGAGGLGRALLQQAAHLKRANISVTLLLLGVDPVNGANGTNLCASDDDAALVYDDVVVPRIDASKDKAFPFYHAPVQLLSWMDRNRGRCRLVHVADFLGQGSMLLLAKRAGMPSVQDVAVNVQVHGADAFLFPLSSLKAEPFHPYIHSLERIQMNNADSVVFLSRENALEYEKLWPLPRDVSIIPNIVRPPKIQHDVMRPWKVDVRHVFFYGKMTDRKGLQLFLKAVSLCSPSALADKTVHIVGTRFDEEDHLASLRPFAQSAGVSLAAHYDLDTGSILQLFRQHARDGVVIVPSYVELQSFALFDVFASGAPFLASDIFAHRSQIPQRYHELLLFDPVPRQLAASIEKRLRKQFLWTFNTSAWIPVGQSERLWISWYSKRLGPVSKTSGFFPKRQEKKRQARLTVAIVGCSSPQFMPRAWSSVLAQEEYPLSLVDVLLIQSCSNSTNNCSTSLDAILDHSPPDAERDKPRPPQHRHGASSSLRPKVSCVDAGAGSRVSVVSRGKARNLAVLSARTSAVLLLDETDELREDALASFARALENNADSGVFTSFSGAFDQASGTASLKNIVPAAREYYIGPAPEVGFYKNALGGSAMLVNRDSDFWKASGGFRDEYVGFENRRHGVSSIRKPKACFSFFVLNLVNLLDPYKKTKKTKHSIVTGCEDWDMLQKAAIVDALELIPQALVMQQTPADERTGWSKEEQDGQGHIQNVRCHNQMLRDVSSFMAEHPLDVDSRKLFSTLLYSVAMHLRHNRAAM
jgi:hypothetical protein